MRFSVRHLSLYRYDVPVRLGPHLLRLTPRPDSGQLRTWQVHVQPGPVQQRTLDDAHGNRLVQLEFAGACRELRVESRFELLTRAPAPIAGDLPPLPWVPLDGPSSAPVDPSVQAFARGLAVQAGGDALGFLDGLARTLHGFDRHLRLSGDAHPAAHTLATRRGACRDLTVLFMETVRAQGMHSRFVSGYQAQAETVDGQRHLHAWPEVLLGSAGYRGWDPTHGMRVGEGHVPLCAAPAQAETMPIEGGLSFDGSTLNSTLDFSLRIDTGPAG